jgi:hypothetical protein
MGNLLLCLGQGVDMGEGGWEMCCRVWDRVWIWEREEGKCVTVFGTGCGYGRGRKGNVLLCLGQGVDMGEGGREMCFCVWDRVWIWERDEGRCVAVFCDRVWIWERDEVRCVAVFGTGCRYGRGMKEDVRLHL